jgi:hypothetical protein
MPRVVKWTDEDVDVDEDVYDGRSSIPDFKAL